MKVADLKPNPKNPRKISEARLEMLKKAMEEYGDLGGFIYNRKTKHLIGGHQRAKVFEQNSEVVIENKYPKPTRTGTVAEGFVILHGERFRYREVSWDETKEKAATIAANKSAGDWDNNLLAEWFTDISDFGVDLDLTMFDALEVKKLLSKKREGEDFNTDPDDVPSEVPARSQPGDVFHLGQHRLMCGDSTDLDQVQQLMAGEKAAMVFTDPPYNINYQGGAGGKSKKRKAIDNDNLGVDFYGFLLKVFSNLASVSKPGASAYVTHADTERVNFTKAFMDAGFHLSSVIIWVKNNATFGRQDYFWQHEPILYGWLNTGAHEWIGPTTETTVWEIDRPSRSDEHPTMKPIELMERAITNSCHHGDLVVDLFLGSGSTLIASEKSGRKCYGMELSPQYCDTIIARWEAFTGKRARKEGEKLPTRRRRVEGDLAQEAAAL